jgi:UDP-xylose/UDP-N-acetylglucosamine transporter B4
VYGKYGKDAWREGLFYIHFLGLPAFTLFYKDIGQTINEYNQSELVSIGIVLRDTTMLIGPLARYFYTVFGGDFLIPMQIPILWGYLLLNVMTQLVCIIGVAKLTSITSSVSVNLVLSVRKFLSLILSILIFKNEFGNMNWVGAVLVFMGTLFYALST